MERTVDFLFQKTEDGEWDNNAIPEYFLARAEEVGLGFNELHRMAGLNEGHLRRYARGIGIGYRSQIYLFRKLFEALEYAESRLPCQAAEAFEGIAAKTDAERFILSKGLGKEFQAFKDEQEALCS